MDRIRRRLRGESGKRFVRFVAAAVAAVITSQVTLAVLTGPAQVSAGTSGVVAAMVAALVSYLMSRWAWERKGRPDLVRETLPFWTVSLVVWLILGATAHFASVWAHAHGYHHATRHLVVQGAYLLMNCVTFLGRFTFFHHVLFVDRDQADRHGEITPGDSVRAQLDASR
ncbi:MAG TPA: rhomboid family intramembrane serine protease [Acidimicrobiales bacterium]|nr:rhomboid family intramembrane serine protease [Acidimicrobiales bacterium]